MGIRIRDYLDVDNVSFKDEPLFKEAVKYIKMEEENMGYWLARDKSGKMFKYDKKPVKHQYSDIWVMPSAEEGEPFGKFEEVKGNEYLLYSHVRWEDSEPTYVAEPNEELITGFWVARDADGGLCKFEGKPEKFESSGIWDTNDPNLSVRSINNEYLNEVFSNVKWEDEEPTYVNVGRDGYELRNRPTVRIPFGVERKVESEFNFEEVAEAIKEFEKEEALEEISTNSILEPEVDMVNHPPHYQGKYEVIDIIEQAVEGLEPFQAYCIGNVVKYVMRHSKKNGIEDLKKAAFYLNRVIDHEENSENE